MGIESLIAPTPENLKDGYFTGANGTASNTDNLDTVSGYNPNSTQFWNVPAITMTVSKLGQNKSSNKRIVYINGINTSKEEHAHTVRLISKITGAKVIGIYNQSGGGTPSSFNIVSDLIQCLGDKTFLNNNPASSTVGHSVYEACRNGKYLNIVAHSQGALITSRGLRQGILTLLLDFVREDQRVSTLVNQLAKLNVQMLDELDDLKKKINDTVETHILPKVELLLSKYVSVQTFGGAGTFFPDGPAYRHVTNKWDPVSYLGQKFLFSGGGRGATHQPISRNSSMNIFNFANHSMDAVYLKSSEDYKDRTGSTTDINYIPIKMDMVRE